MQKKRLAQSRQDQIFDIINISLIILIGLVMLYPLYFIVIASVSEPHDVILGKVTFVPSGLTFEAYENVLKEQRIWVGYRNTLIYTVCGTLFNLALTLPCGYVLSKHYLPGHKFFTFFFLFTMYFSGGMIPSYLLIKSLGLLNHPLTLVIVGGISIYNMIITRTYFESSIPGDIYESASIDGATDFRCFFSIALPLAKPIIAVMALYYAVAHWNSYFSALLYVSKTDYQPLQLVLRSILLLNQSALTSLDLEIADEQMVIEMARRAYLAEAMKYALIFIASAPLMIAYPFVQKYFVKGVMIGAVKG